MYIFHTSISSVDVSTSVICPGNDRCDSLSEQTSSNTSLDTKGNILQTNLRHSFLKMKIANINSDELIVVCLICMV